MDKGKKEVMIDNEPFAWDKKTITGLELRTLGNVPQNAQIFHEIPGKPDVLVNPTDVIDLTIQKGIDRFSTDTADSGAGASGIVA